MFKPCIVVPVYNHEHAIGAVLTGLLVAHGATPAAALAVTVLARLLTLWLAVAIGVLALLYSAAIRKEISFR